MSREVGIEGLDKLLGGGFDASSSIGILGERGTKRDLFSYIFAETGVKRNQPTLYFCSNKNPKSLRREFEKREIDRSDFLKIVDCYSWRLRESDSVEELAMKSNNLNEFLNLFDEARNLIGDNGRSVVDSLNSIVGFDGLSAADNVLQVLFAEEEDSSNSLLISMNTTYRDKIISLAVSYVDGFVELKRHRGDRYLKVHWMSDNDYFESWHQYNIERGVSEETPLSIIIGSEVEEEVSSELSDKSSLA